MQMGGFITWILSSAVSKSY